MYILSIFYSRLCSIDNKDANSMISLSTQNKDECDTTYLQLLERDTQQIPCVTCVARLLWEQCSSCTGIILIIAYAYINQWICLLFCHRYYKDLYICIQFTAVSFADSWLFTFLSYISLDVSGVCNSLFDISPRDWIIQGTWCFTSLINLLMLSCFAHNLC